MNPHAYARRQSGEKRGQYRTCKYCFNASVRHQGLCHECLQRPKEENKKQLAIMNAKMTLGDFLLQKNMSAKNLKTIKGFCDSKDGELHEFASLVLMIGTRFPRKKNGTVESASKTQNSINNYAKVCFSIGWRKKAAAKRIADKDEAVENDYQLRPHPIPNA